MAEPKTKPTKASVTGFLNKIADERKRRDAFAIANMMEEISKEKPVMWGPSIVGFGTWTYEYARGKFADWPMLGFSPRAQALTVYLLPGFEERDELMSKLGKYKTGKSCLYFKTLDDVHIPTLKTLIRKSMKELKDVADDPVQLRERWAMGDRGSGRRATKSDS